MSYVLPMGRMMSNVEEFLREVHQFSREIVPEKFVEFHKKVVLDALSKLVRKTPVDTGRARLNWNVGIGAPDDSVREDTAPGKTAPVAEGQMGEAGLEVFKRGLVAMSDLGPFQVVYVSNNVIYIEFLEQGRSTQAPNGMLSLTMTELREMFP